MKIGIIFQMVDDGRQTMDGYSLTAHRFPDCSTFIYSFTLREAIMDCGLILINILND